MPTLDPVLYRTPLIDTKTGLVTREWIRYFESLNAALNAISGGLTATINTSTTPNLTLVDGVVTRAV